MEFIRKSPNTTEMENISPEESLAQLELSTAAKISETPAAEISEAPATEISEIPEAEISETTAAEIPETPKRNSLPVTAEPENTTEYPSETVGLPQPKEKIDDSTVITPKSIRKSSRALKCNHQRLSVEIRRQQTEASSSQSSSKASTEWAICESSTEASSNESSSTASTEEVISELSATALTEGTISMKPQINTNDRVFQTFMNEFLGVRNEDGGFYICKSIETSSEGSSEVRIQWLNKQGGTYVLDFCDLLDLDCILTTVRMTKNKQGNYKLPKKEEARIKFLLREAIAISKVEDQLEKERNDKRKTNNSSDTSEDEEEEASAKKGRTDTSEVNDN